MKYGHIVFDVDGTLLDTSLNILQSLKDALAETDGIQKNLNELEFVLGSTSLVSLDRLKIRNASKTLDLWLENEAKNLHLIRLFDGMGQLLTELTEAGYRLGIITSRTHEELELVLAPAPIHSFFPIIICSDDVASPKPAPDSLFRYMELTRSAADQILFVGDTIQDMKCAAGAGVDFALARWGTHDKSLSPKNIFAEYQPQSPEDLGRLLL